MSVITRGGYQNQIADVGLKLAEFFDQGLNIYTPGISQLLTTKTGDGAQKNYESMTTGGELVKVEEGEAATDAARYLGYLTQVRYTKYMRSLSVTQEMIDDRSYEPIFDEAAQLGRNANYSMDRSGMQLFNGAFSTTRTVNGYEMTWYGDGKATYSTVHPSKVPGASTQSNAHGSGAVLSLDSLETAKLALTAQKTDDGFPTGYAGSPVLVVPSALLREAQELTMSEKTPGNDYNTINVFKGAFTLATSLHLDATNGGSDTAWFVVTPGMDKQYHEVRKAPTIEMDKTLKTQVHTFVISARWANWVGDWRQKYASKGDAQSYTA